jgi:hypothetical protein
MHPAASVDAAYVTGHPPRITVPAPPSVTDGPPGIVVLRKYGANGGQFASGRMKIPLPGIVYVNGPVGHQSVTIVIGKAPKQAGGRLTSIVKVQHVRFCGCACAALGAARIMTIAATAAIRVERIVVDLI